MPRIRAVTTVVPILLLALAAAAGIAVGAEETLDTLLRPTPPASAPPPLLGPISEEGRSGWTCVPELRATARRAVDAALPADDR